MKLLFPKAKPDCVRKHLEQPLSEDAALDFISHALHELGPAAGPALMNAMVDRNSGVRRAAAGSFPYGGCTQGAADTPEVVAWVVKMLEMPDFDPKQSAAMMLGMMGVKAKPAVPEIRRIMLQFSPERMQPEGGADLLQTVRDALRLIDRERDPVDMLVPCHAGCRHGEQALRKMNPGTLHQLHRDSH